MREEDIILAEKYLENQLSETERIEVESRIASDEKFAETVDFIRNIETAFERQKDIENRMPDIRFSIALDESAYKKKQLLKEKFNDELNYVAKEYENENKGKGGNVRKINFYQSFGIAASVLLLLGISIFFLLKNDVSSPQLAELDDLKKNKSIHLVKDVSYFTNELAGITGAPDNEPAIKLLKQKFTIKNLPIVIILDTKYKSHYFYDIDTLFLLGDFNENIVLTNDSEKVFIFDELKQYSFKLEKTSKIEPLDTFNSELPKINDHVE